MSQSVVYEKAQQPNELDPNLIAAIDIGVDNLAAVTSNHKGFRPILVNGESSPVGGSPAVGNWRTRKGKHIKSVNQFYNKRKAQLQFLLKGNKKTSNRIAKLSTRRNGRVDHYLPKCKCLYYQNTGAIRYRHAGNW